MKQGEAARKARSSEETKGFEREILSKLLITQKRTVYNKEKKKEVSGYLSSSLLFLDVGLLEML
jgi:hypothetical protein